MDGSGAVDILRSVPSDVYGFLVVDDHAGKVYWTDHWDFGRVTDSREISRSNFDGTDDEVFLVPGGAFGRLAVDSESGWVYYCNGPVISRIRMDGSRKTNLYASGGPSVFHLVVGPK
jgi:hypothetical protein